MEELEALKEKKKLLDAAKKEQQAKLDAQYASG
jgi:hypothetical protein